MNMQFTDHRASAKNKKHTLRQLASNQQKPCVICINMQFTDARVFAEKTKHTREHLAWNQQKRALYVQTCSSRITAWATTLVKHTRMRKPVGKVSTKRYLFCRARASNGHYDKSGSANDGSKQTTYAPTPSYKKKKNAHASN